MTRKKSPKAKSTRNSYPPEFRQEALLLATKVGVAEAAGKLGIQPNLIYTWRRQVGGDTETREACQAMQSENARLKRLLKQFGMHSSMSRKGDCWDNAVAESFFHSLKIEAVHGEAFATREEMRKAVFEYVEIYYNRERLHSTIGHQTPEQFEQRKAK